MKIKFDFQRTSSFEGANLSSEEECLLCILPVVANPVSWLTGFAAFGGVGLGPARCLLLPKLPTGGEHSFIGRLELSAK